MCPSIFALMAWIMRDVLYIIHTRKLYSIKDEASIHSSMSAKVVWHADILSLPRIIMCEHEMTVHTVCLNVTHMFQYDSWSESSMNASILGET